MESDEITCPICFRRCHVIELFYHMLTFHEDFLGVFMFLNDPDGAEAFFDDANSYENLSRLCEEIGDHIVPTEPDTVSVLHSESPETTCPVCLETTKTNVRTLNVCKHSFCNACISQWLSRSKKCPVCKVDTTNEEA